MREYWPRHPLGNLTLSNQLSTPATQCFIYSLFQLVFPLDINEICLCFSCTLYLGPIHSHIAARHQQTRIRNEIEEGRKINNIRLFYAWCNRIGTWPHPDTSALIYIRKGNATAQQIIFKREKREKKISITINTDDIKTWTKKHGQIRKLTNAQLDYHSAVKNKENIIQVNKFKGFFLTLSV